jgi:hypothetical protein
MYRGFIFLNYDLMNSKNTPATSYDPKKLTEFFNDTIDPETLAKMIRHLNHVIALTLMRKNETLECHTKELEDGFYWLNELAEILNPYLDID